VVWKPVGKKGLQSRLYAATTQAASRVAYMKEFLRIMREVSFSTLRGIEPLSG
jgi:LysR family transcriptional regulator for metE and metH